MSEEEPVRRGRPGGVGAEIFEQVERLVKDEGLTRSQAFQRLSEETDRRAGTVAANYYRIARQRGAELRPRAPRSEGGRGRPRRGGGGKTDTDAVVQRAMDAIKELGDLVRSQERELQSLRELSAQLSKIQGLMREAG
jgi:hypothetical protein